MMGIREAFSLALLTTIAASPLARAADSSLPRLEQTTGAARLIVDGAPFLIRGGELGNSSASNREYMKDRWAKLGELRLNTVLMPVSWDLVEPEEGEFDFSLVDGLIEDARAHDMRLVLLWFGSWKNSMSCYAPEWVKRDQERFLRCQTSAGKGLEILSPFSDANVAADARAFAALMKHLREFDGGRHTVIMVQVENEVGMIPEARDHSPPADAAFAQVVPADLMKHLASRKDALPPELRDAWKTSNFAATGDWKSCFGAGPAAEEAFMAWHFGRYVDRVAAAGKAEYALPMFVNAALPRPGFAPGQYPSAGPLPHLADVWRAAAPHVDFLAPDVYFPNFVEWCDKYAAAGQPLFIPEARLTDQNAASALYAVGAHGAIGFSPFSIESIENPAGHPLQEAYRLLEELTPLVVAHSGQKTMAGVAPRVPFDEKKIAPSERIDLGDYTLTVMFETRDPWAPPGNPPAPAAPSGGILFSTGPDEFLIAGTGVVVTFVPRTAGPPQAGIASAQEGRFVDGTWKPGRWLNGDQTHQGRHVRIPAGTWGMQKVKLYRYE